MHKCLKFKQRISTGKRVNRMKRMFYNLGFVLKYYWKENKIYVISFFLKIVFGAIIIAVDSTLLLKIVFDCFDNS